MSNEHDAERDAGTSRGGESAVDFLRALALGVHAWGADLGEVARVIAASETSPDSRRALILRAASECAEFRGIALDVEARLRELADATEC